jgi:pyruvate dehydrogenase E2 component (dihydrolipoamide acetyltransferase)
MIDGVIVEQTKMRAAIAKRMAESKQQAPHFYVQTEVVIDGLHARLDVVNEHNATRVTMTAALACATAHALRRHPKLNCVWTADGLLRASGVNLGIAVALDDGLVAPALLGADGLGLPALAIALDDLVARARAGRLRPAELSEATFTLSNLGMFDVTAFTAIVTPPQVAILAVARPVARWSFDKGNPVSRSVMTATLSADHRALDGVDAARFLETFKHSIESSEAFPPEPEEVMS